MHVKEKDMVSYLENALTMKKQKNLERHLAMCPLCQKKLEEWKSLYDTIECLSFDFKLEGMEERICNRIKAETTVPSGRAKEPELSLSMLCSLCVFIFTGVLFFMPQMAYVGHIAEQSGNFLLNQGLKWFNEVKWPVIDAIVSIQTIELSFLYLSAGILLMVGGVYLYFGNKQAKKAA